MQIVIDVPDELSREATLAVLGDCVDYAAKASICTSRTTQAQQDAYLAVAYHLRKAIRAAQSSERNPVINGAVVAASESPELTSA